MTDKKIKILTLSDHPLLPSGVGTQTKYIIEALLNTKKFQVISFGGAVKHDNYNATKTHEYGDDWIIFPVDGYGTPEQLRSALHIHKDTLPHHVVVASIHQVAQTCRSQCHRVLNTVGTR